MNDIDHGTLVAIILGGATLSVTVAFWQWWRIWFRYRSLERDYAEVIVMANDQGQEIAYLDAKLRAVTADAFDRVTEQARKGDA